MLTITIAYLSCRKDPKIEWFLGSLYRQLESLIGPDAKLTFGGLNIRVVFVDFYRDERQLGPWAKFPSLWHVTPKPCVWQGPHRITKENWFAASNARNTALCHAPDGWIVYVDDLSVLMPGWFNAVREAVAGNYIAEGAYKKVKNLVVENGVAKSWDEFPGGVDSRWHSGMADEPITANGDWMYGCSVAMPVEALLTINGWPEDLCDGLGSEDYCCGIALQNAGYNCKYDRRMLTLESEELHFVEPAFKRSDYGVSPADKSHAALNIARQSKYFPNHFNMRELRQKILAGEPFPVDVQPRHCWFTGRHLSDL